MRALRILIAVNHWAVSARLTAQLQNLGHQVVGVAENGRQAVASVTDVQPDLAILDFRLPVMDGIEAARAIMARDAVPIVLLTPYASGHLVRRAREAGIMACLASPAGRRELRMSLTVALARFGELEAIRQQESGSPEQALEIRLVVEEAKRFLMRWLKLSEGEAFRRLERDSRTSRTRLREVASMLVKSDEVLFRKPHLTRTVRVLLSAVRQEDAAAAGMTV